VHIHDTKLSLNAQQRTCCWRICRSACHADLLLLVCDSNRADAEHHVLLLTGWDETFLKYAEVISKLIDAKCAVYTMDHRGLGLSGRTIPDEQV
jgi:alpha-beta hydrolase superfamily lysophospholipase